jgi:hypothetical protein
MLKSEGAPLTSSLCTSGVRESFVRVVGETSTGG